MTVQSFIRLAFTYMPKPQWTNRHCHSSIVERASGVLVWRTCRWTLFDSFPRAPQLRLPRNDARMCILESP